MYATVRIYTGSHELADGLVANENAVKRVVSDIDGFKAYYLIRTAAAVRISPAGERTKVGRPNPREGCLNVCVGWFPSTYARRPRTGVAGVR